MTKEYLQEFGIAMLLIIALILFFDPLMLLMPGQVGMMVILIAVVLFLAFAVFIWKERALDEREEYHRALASRTGWLAGATILMIGLVIQGMQHAVDPWLVYALLGMVIAKIVTRIYSRWKK